MAISDKLNYLLETKQAIKQAIIDKGQEVADTDTFRSYAEKIEAIEAGGSGGAYDIEQVLNEATGAFELRITDAVGGEKEFVVNLPSEFATATNIYYFQVNKDVILFSANLNIGLWEYDIKKRLFAQLLTIGNYFSNFKIIGNDCLISGTSATIGDAQGLYLYNATSREITKIYEQSYSWSKFNNIGNNWYISSSSTTSSGLLLYNQNSKTITQIYSRGTQWTVWTPFEDNWLISSTSNSGLLFYETSTMQIIALKTAGSWQGYQFVNNGVLITGNSSIINSQGVLFFDPATKTITTLITGLYFGAMQLVGNDCLIGTRNDNSTGANDITGVYLYNADTHSVSQIYESTLRYNLFQLVGDDCLICSKKTDTTGVLLYDANSKTITQIYSSGRWTYIVPIENDCLLGGGNTSARGMLLYDANTKTISQLLEDGNYGWGSSYCVMGNDCLISGYSGNGVVLYETATKTASKIYTTGNNYRFFKYGNDCLIYSSVASYKGIWLYNGETKTMAQIFSSGYNYDIYKFDANGNIYISASDKVANPYTLYYNATTKAATLAGYYVEVE